MREFFRQQWPAEDWPLILAQLGEWFHWSRADLGALTPREAGFWLGAIGRIIEARANKTEN